MSTQWVIISGVKPELKRRFQLAIPFFSSEKLQDMYLPFSSASRKNSSSFPLASALLSCSVPGLNGLL